MARRNPNLRQLPSGKWQARIRADGERISVGTFNTKTEAATALRAVERELDAGTIVMPTGVTVDEYLTDWIATNQLRAKTRDTYRYQYQRYISPTLGELEMTELSPAIVRRWFHGLPENTQRPKVYRLLRSACNTAIDEKVIAANPCTMRKAGYESAPERPVATVPQVFAIADAVAPNRRLMVLVAAFVGARLGEVLELRRSDINIDRAQVSITRQRQELSDGSFVVGPPKTNAGLRTITMPAFMVDDARTHLAEHSGLGRDALLFRGVKGGPLRRGVWRKEWVAALAGIEGIPDGFHFHDLRHTGNTLAASVPGTITKDLMQRFGHASSRAALMYQHASQQKDAAIAAGLDDIVADVIPMRRTG